MIKNKAAFIKTLAETRINTDEYSVVPAKSGAQTVLFTNGERKIYMESKYDPIKAAKQYAKSIYTNAENIAIYGLSLGYHIIELHALLTNGQKLYVLETDFNIAKIAIENNDVNADIMGVLDAENVVFCCTEDLYDMAVELDYVTRQLGSDFHVYGASFETMPKSMEKLKDVLFDYKAQKNMAPYHGSLMEENARFNEAQNYEDGIERFTGAFEGKPAIIISAGASLNMSMDALAKVRKKAVVIAVSRAGRQLPKYGITPDFFVYADAGKNLSWQLDFETIRTPLFLLSTSDTDSQYYKGEKFIVYEKGAAKNKENGVEVGGSVATLALSIAVKMGANPVVLVGQDLCYCFEKTHADGNRETPKPPKTGRYVLANDGEKYYTTGSLYIFLRWIERFIARNKNISFYNATAKGAIIEGAQNVDLLKFFENFPDIN